MKQCVVCLVQGTFMMMLPEAHALESQVPNAVLEEVVVTARGRSEKLFDIPDSIAAYSADEIEKRNIRSIEDVAAHTPGVFLVNDQDPGTNIVTIRGISANRLQEASVAYVIDGVTVGDTELFTADYFDLERIEVLKGPQGALYGKNAIGGVFNIVTKAPENTFGGSLEAGLGDASSYTLSGTLTGPIVEDRVSFRLTASHRDNDGRITNTTAQEKVDYYTSTNLRGRLVADITDNLTLDARLAYVDEDGGSSWISSNEVTRAFNGRLAGAALIEPVGDYLGTAERDWTSGSIKLDYEFDNGGVVTSISAFDDYEKWWDEDLDFLPIPLFQPVAQPVELEIFTQELRYTSPDDSGLRWIVGVFYQDKQRNREDDIRPLGIWALSEIESEQWAIFGQASWDITDRLELTAALRYDRDSREEVVTELFSGNAAPVVSADYSKVQPKLSLAYRFAEDHMAYATYAKGFKSGGFNPDPGLLPGATWERAFDDESTDTIEIGTKSSWDGNRYTLNVAAFYTDHSDKQEFTFTPAAQVTFNVPEVEVMGVEVAATAMPAENLLLDVGFSWIDSEIQDFSVVAFNGPQDYAGNQTPNNQEYNLNLGASYSFDFENGSELTARVDLQRVGETYWEIDNILYSPAHNRLNAMLTYRHSDRWSVRLWGNNITDEDWAISAFGQTQLPLLTVLGIDIFTINPGRSYGLTLRADF